MNYLFTINSDEVDWSNVEEQVNKYVPLHKALDTFDEPAVQVITRMAPFLKHEHKRILVDYKVRVQKKGDNGCPVVGWHFDCVKDFNHPAKHEHHMIYSNMDGTLFLDGCNILQFADGSVVEYGRELHDAPILREDMKRIVIRVTETDSI